MQDIKQTLDPSKVEIKDNTYRDIIIDLANFYSSNFQKLNKQKKFYITFSESKKMIYYYYKQSLNTLYDNFDQYWENKEEIITYTTWIQDKWQTIVNKIEQCPQSIQHGDFRKENILITDKEFYVIDWQGIFIGPMTYDLAYFMLHLSDKNIQNQDIRYFLNIYYKEVNKGDQKYTTHQIDYYFKLGLILAIIRIIAQISLDKTFNKYNIEIKEIKIILYRLNFWFKVIDIPKLIDSFN